MLKKPLTYTDSYGIITSTERCELVPRILVVSIAVLATLSSITQNRLHVKVDGFFVSTSSWEFENSNLCRQIEGKERLSVILVGETFSPEYTLTYCTV